MAYHFRNFSLEGGGVKGIAYVGAMRELKKLGILDNITRVGGTSAGAINATLFALGYTIEETRKIMWKLDFNKFLDDSWGVLRDFERLKDKYGWYKGDYFRDWIKEIIAAKTGNPESTFGDLHRKRKDRGFRDLYVVGTNLSTRFSEVFSFEHTPRTCIADAVRISMSIPLFFAAVRSVRKDVYVDGGVLNNYPVKLFDRKKYIDKKEKGKGKKTDYYDNHNKALKAKGVSVSSEYVYNKQTLGFRLDSAKEIAVFRDHAEPQHHKIDDLFDYAWGLIETIYENQNNTHLHSDDWHRTVYIDTLGVKTTEFDLTEVRKKKLVKSGAEAVRKYFQWYDTARGVHNK